MATFLSGCFTIAENLAHHIFESKLDWAPAGF